MKVLVTYPFGLGGVCMTELRHMGFSPMKKGYALMIDDVQRKDVYRINLWSRIANKVFVVLGEQTVMNFDALFDLVGAIDWKQYIGVGHGIRVLAHTRESQLSSTRTIQSIAHKSIVTTLTGSRDVHWEHDESSESIEISVDIYKDMATILLNTSGASLHERGYRTEQGEAPLKENIAAGLLLLSGWDKKSPLFDPFCGSGTICIEAAMMAAAIAPGLFRSFAFEKFGNFDGFVYASLRDVVERKLKVQNTVTSRSETTRSIGDIKQDNSYTSPPLSSKGQVVLFGSDIDVHVLAKAQANAHRAGVEHMIDFQERHFLDVDFRLYNAEKVWCVTNPPYGVRLGQESEELVEDLIQAFTSYRLFGGFLLLRGAKTPGFSQVALLNGQQEVCFYKK